MESKESRIQDILSYIRFDIYGIKQKIEENLDLFEEDNLDHPIKEDKSEWNEEYIAANLVWLRKNFSRKRLEHLIEVRDFVRGKIEEPIKKETIEIKKTKSDERETTQKKTNYKTSTKKKEDSLIEKVKTGVRIVKSFLDSSPKEKKRTKDYFDKMPRKK